LQPILDLTSLVNKVAKNKDFSLRARKTSNDELGVLMDGFNSMLEQINHLAFYDHLTGLANRHTFKHLLKSSLQLASRQQQNLAVLFLDLDNFVTVHGLESHLGRV
jgi:PleD family two-component response regulator